MFVIDGSSSTVTRGGGVHFRTWQFEHGRRHHRSWGTIYPPCKGAGYRGLSKFIVYILYTCDKNLLVYQMTYLTVRAIWFGIALS